MPVARNEIRRWTQKASNIPDDVLRQQALASLTTKRFHSDGGSVYAAQQIAGTRQLVRLIVALQTISDYLDNLCDRCETYDERDFHQLHHAMRDAVNPDAPLRPYYALRGYPDDGGYLADLVTACQSEIRQLPGYDAAKPYVEWLTQRYCELQEYKHIEPSQRQPRLIEWAKGYEEQFPELSWWEFAAATGSTLGTFALFAAAQNALSKEQAEAIWKGYFPWLCGLHILLDYLIDLEEDIQEGDFNFVQSYPSMGQAYSRLRRFKAEALQHVQGIEANTNIHRHVVNGLLAMYLSDNKVGRQAKVQPARKLVWSSGPTTWLFYGACIVYRIVR
ncbi:tetraprenyl-beta-curcumene synthase family protein [Alicyclobacillus sp. SO9]|uniref:tetraprenyl-beta-curcumene synthase family protein n=1 Tax=Alicyclobacillus sp. SO9 TaxID=2665646 RepID=UPI001E5B27B3|nr:tetraprenyl-beta-curcumene synthase family protein [Alicyclobacillus sp. SO9]